MSTTNIESYDRRTVVPEPNSKILVCNAGSSSLKFSFFDSENEMSLAEGGIDWVTKPTRMNVLTK
jgi:acetate kinase